MKQRKSLLLSGLRSIAFGEYTLSDLTWIGDKLNLVLSNRHGETFPVGSAVNVIRLKNSVKLSWKILSYEPQAFPYSVAVLYDEKSVVRVTEIVPVMIEDENSIELRYDT
jgi:hypothetical protein